MTSITLRTREILVLSSGSSTQERNNRKGHLFEEFIANLLHKYGYEKPRRENLNVSANGIELDVTGRHDLTNEPMIAECKAYSSPVAARELAAFYGKLGTARFDNVDTFGYFVAIPSLSPDGIEQARKIAGRDKSFRFLAAQDILQFLEEKLQIERLETVVGRYREPQGELSDEALLVTEHGLFLAAKELNTTTRLPIRILVFGFRSAPVPAPVLELLKTSSFAAGAACEEAESKSHPQGAIRVTALAGPGATTPTVVEVTGSSNDFEYQYPASPRYFVGRREYISDAEQELDTLITPRAKARVVVINAQSGWGKSSFALKVIDTARKRGGFGTCVDSRTADGPAFVCAALRHCLQSAERRKAVKLPASPSFASLHSSLETLRRTTFSKSPVCLFFDQFENVFRDFSTTQEFRNLALAIADLEIPVLLGFAWKTDLVAFTEGHPYQLRDDIRTRARVISLDPFGADDVSKLLGRMQKASKTKLHRDLREKLREYSQGLPWLLKKLVAHILRELRGGVRQEALIAESLNVHSLFESDLKTLSPEERSAIQAIARNAPILASDAVEIARSPKVVQSLVDQRLLVQIGERLDVYWDTFRDYLNRGVVPIEEGYILRLTPKSASKLLLLLRKGGGATTSEAAAEELGTSRIAIFNVARDLRQLGILAAVEGTLQFSDELRQSPDLEEAIRQRANTGLKRHRAYSLLGRMAKAGASTTMSAFAAELPRLYPAVAANSKTWSTYARSFAYWFDYAGIATVQDDRIALGPGSGAGSNLLEPTVRRPRGIVVFPRCHPEPVLQVVDSLASGVDPSPNLTASTLKRAVGDAELLGLLQRLEGDRLSLTSTGKLLASSAAQARTAMIAEVIANQASAAIARKLLAVDPGTRPKDLGLEVARHYGLAWTDGTATGCGKWLRAWMRLSGITTRMRAGSRSPAKSST